MSASPGASGDGGGPAPLRNASPGLSGRRHVALRLGVALLAALGTVLATELVLHLTSIGDPVDGTDVLQRWIPGDLFVPVQDPVGYVLRPDYVGVQRYTSQVTGEVVHEATARTNAQGLRAESERTTGHVIVALGDSTTFGVGVSEGESWPAALEARLDTSWRVVNAGVPGWNEAQAVRWYELHATEVRASIAILAFYINDVEPPVPVAGEHPGQRMKAPPWSARETGLRRVSRLYNLGWRSYERRRLARALSGSNLTWVEHLVKGARIEDMQRGFETFRRAAQRAGARPVVALLPVLDVADPTAAAPILARAAEAAGRLQLPVLHVENALDEMDVAERIVIPAERHASAAGNARIGAAVERELRAKGFL